MSRYCCVYWRTFIIIYWYHTTGWIIVNLYLTLLVTKSSHYNHRREYVFLFHTVVGHRVSLSSCSSLNCSNDTQWINFMFFWPCISIHPCDENQLVAIFILSLFRQSTSTCFGHICCPSSGGILHIYSNCYVLWQQTVNWKAQHVPIAVYIQYTSWWWATNMLETCRGWRTK